jgi:hypothetical protein
MFNFFKKAEPVVYEEVQVEPKLLYDFMVKFNDGTNEQILNCEWFEHKEQIGVLQFTPDDHSVIIIFLVDVKAVIAIPVAQS